MTTPQIVLHHTASAPHILVMDESREVLALLHDLLTEEGFTLTLSSQLLDLEQIRGYQPSLIIMERRFDGLLAPSWDVVRRTRQDRDLARIPIVLSTTHRSSRFSARTGQELGELGVHILLKPYTVDDLLGTVHACLTSVAARGADMCRRQRNTPGYFAGSAVNSTGTLQNDVQALLFPDGRVVVYDDPLRQLANWHILGRIRQDGELLSFVRIDSAGASWTALIPSTSLEQEAMPLCVPLLRQCGPSHEPLAGWPLFC